MREGGWGAGKKTGLSSGERSGTPKLLVPNPPSTIHCTFKVLLALANHVKSAILVKNLTAFRLVRFALSFSSEQCSCAAPAPHSP